MYYCGELVVGTGKCDRRFQYEMQGRQGLQTTELGVQKQQVQEQIALRHVDHGDHRCVFDCVSVHVRYHRRYGWWTDLRSNAPSLFQHEF